MYAGGLSLIKYLQPCNATSNMMKLILHGMQKKIPHKPQAKITVPTQYRDGN